MLIATVLAGMWRSLRAATPGRREFGAFIGAVMVALLFHFATPHVLPWLWWMQWFRSLPIT